MQVEFGTGILSLIPSGSNPTPVRVGILQDVSIDLGFDQVLLYGEKAFAVDVANGKGKASLKAKTGAIGPGLLGAVLGGTSTTGSKIGIADESCQVATNTCTVAQGATFYEDLGVYNTVTGKWMTRGATATGAGVYAVNTGTGVYTFNAADSNPLVLISYSYTASSTGKTLTVSNPLMGAATLYKLELFQNFRSKAHGLIFPAVAVPKLAGALKNDAHSLYDLELMAVADSSGYVCYAYTADE